MILKSLHLVNFQIWKDLQLQFVPGINAIIGPSDRGKSSILRALYWLAHNDPSGDEFMRDGANHCFVEGTFSDGNIIRRLRSKKENKYVINNKDFSTVRTGVPEEARKIMRLTETNFQMQDDPFFLLGLSGAGDVAKKLNQVVGLDLIDTSLSYPDKIIRRMNAKIKLYESELKDKEKELRKFEGLEKITSLYEKLEKLQEEHANTEEEISNLNFQIENLVSLKSTVKRYMKLSDIDKKLALTIKKKKRRENEALAAEKLRKIIRDMLQNRKIVKSHKKSYKKLEELNKKLIHLTEQWSTISITENRLRELINLITEWNLEIKDKRKRKEKLEKRLDKLKTELKICPTCGKPFEEEE